LKAKNKLKKRALKKKLAVKRKKAIKAALKLRKTLNKIAAKKQKLAKKLFMKKALKAAAVKQVKQHQKEVAARKKAINRIADKAAKAMKQHKKAAKAKKKVVALANKAGALRAKLGALRNGQKIISTRNVIEDGLGDGKLEDGFSRNVPRPDRQMQQISDELVGQVMGNAGHLTNIKQDDLDFAGPLMNEADQLRGTFQDFKIRMKKERATPDGWPSVVYEAEAIED